MKKYFLFVMAVLAGLFTSCKEEAPVMGGDTEVGISITVPEGALGTRAMVEGSARFEDPAMNGMRVALIVSNEQGKVLNVYTQSHDFGTTGQSAANFKIRFVKGQKYNITAWADFGDSYYTLPNVPDALGNLSDAVVKAAITRTGSKNTNDCYFKNELIQITENQSINLALKRPVALVKVNTNDWNLNEVKYANFRPDFYQVKVTAPTEINVISGVAGNPQEITCAAAIVEYNIDGSPKEMHYDYLLANAESAILPAFTVEYFQGGKAVGSPMSDFTYENIPVQRNYKTNISGNILTKLGDINVTIDNSWNTPDMEITIKEVATPSAANSDLAENKADTKAKGYVIKSASSTDNTIIIPDSTKAASLAYTLEDLGTNNSITVKDQTPELASALYPNEVTLTVPEVSGEKPTIYINTQSAHVTVIGDANIVYANTSENTFVVAKGSAIATIVVQKGNVELYGEVGSIVRDADNPDAKTLINIYDGAVWTNWATEKASNNIQPIVNCGTYAFDPTGYNVEGSVVIANEGTPATWTVTIDNEWSSHAAKEFSNVSGTTITIMNAAELALFAKNVNAKVKYSGYTIKLGSYIDLSAHDWTPIMLVYTPEDENFTFDGCGYTIYGLKMKREEDCSGLFGKFFAGNSIIRNVVINNPQITQKLNSDPTKAKEEVGLNYTAALVAHMGCGNVDNCSIIGGTIAGVEQVGAIVGYLTCGSVTRCSVNGTTISGNNRVGGLAGKAHTGDGSYNINNNKVENANISATGRHDLSGAAALVGQIMTGSTWEINNNYVKDVTTTTNGDATFIPVGEFRKGYFKADAVSGNHIVGNAWYPATTGYYDMKNPADLTQSVRILNNAFDPLIKIGDKGYFTLNEALAEVQNNEIIMIGKTTDAPANVGAIANVSGKTFTIQGTDKTLSVVMIGDGNSYGADGKCDYRFSGANVTFKNLTYSQTSGNAGFQGLTYVGKLNFDNCIFLGLTSYWGEDCTIENSTFEQADTYEYCLWTWGCDKMTIKKTIFNTRGKAIKMYGAGTSVLTVDSCTFNSNGLHTTADKPAIAINTGNYPTDYTVYINHCTQNGFVAGATGSAMYGSDLLSEVQGNLDVFIDDVCVWKDGAANQ